MDLGTVLQALTREFSSSAGPAAGVPEWEGWVFLGILIALFGLAFWWLFFSPRPADRPSTSAVPLSPRTRWALAGLVLLSGVLFTFGARWDELWHRLYGGFGDDFLWPPHLMIYGGLGLNAMFAGLGLGLVRRESGGIRERFRSNSLLGLLGLTAAYQVASIPSDALWHKIIGPDISAWSLPHFLLATSSSGVLVIGLALALARRGERPWRIGGWLSPAEVLALALLVVSTLALLQFAVTEWEWGLGPGGAMPFGRAAWVYPAVVLAVGTVEAHLALHALRRVGAATTLALVALAIQVAYVTVARSVVPPGPFVASHLLLVAPALALDLWYATRLGSAHHPATQARGALLYTSVFVLAAILGLGPLLGYPPLRLPDLAVLLVVALAEALLLGPATAAAAAWLNRVGEPTKGAILDRVPLRPHPDLA